MPCSLLAADSEAAWYTIAQRDWNVLIPFFGYMVGVFVIAIVAHRYQKNAQFESEYYVGGRSFGAWVLAMSWVATLASGGSFLGYPSLVYSYGWSMALWVSGSTVTALVGIGIVGKRINRLARQTGALTLVDLLRDRYQSNAVGVAYACVIVFVTSVYLMAQFVAGGKILQSMLETSYEMGLLLFALSVVAYTTYGGFRAVAWTDTMQGIVMIIGIVMLVPMALNAVGGLEQATAELSQRVDPAAEAKGVPQTKHAYLYGPGPEKIKKDLFNKPAADGSENTPKPGSSPLSDPWLPFSIGISMFMLRSLGSVMMPTTVPRMLAFKDTQALRRALLILGPYFLLMYGSSLITMNCAHSLDLGLAPDQSDQAVPELAKRVAPPILAGMLIAAPFAAVMSTVDSGLLVISATVVRDLVQKTWMPNISEKMTKRLSYLVTGGVGVFVLCLAWEEPPFLQPLVIYCVGGSVSSLFWPGIATLYWKRATGAGVLAGLIGGAVMFVYCNRYRPFDDYILLHPFVYAFTLSAFLVFVVSKASKPQSEDRLAIYFGRGKEEV
ncbi:MAG: hypothetical protein CMJ78_19135 [Planctomycetaceae bacterium]|nr:hypothetical protein [Planctomycetaceae bacterium]